MQTVRLGRTNAIVSAAHFITEVVKLQNLTLGTTLGPNVIHGGSVTNVVADEVKLEVDIRVWSIVNAIKVPTVRCVSPPLIK